MRVWSETSGKDSARGNSSTIGVALVSSTLFLLPWIVSAVDPSLFCPRHMEPDHENPVVVPRYQTAVFGIYSALAYMGSELFLRCVLGRIDRQNTKVRIVKAALGLAFLVKSILFITLERG